MNIAQILKLNPPYNHLTLQAWVRTSRISKNISFLEINDGSCLQNLQLVYNGELDSQITTGASIKVSGDLVASTRPEQKVELLVQSLMLIGPASEDYPLQKKRHSFEFLRTIPHLRIRSNTFGAVFRVRSALSFAIHQFFRERDFLYLHSPIITSNDCEGAGKMFQVTTLDPQKSNDYSQDFFGKKTYLSVSGQLEAEYFAQCFTKVYTFGPTFRAENSNTTRHAAEFWMVEPEVAFSTLIENMQLAEEFIKYITKYVLENCRADIQFFNQWVDNTILARLENLITTQFEIITYTQAIEYLQKSDQKFEFPIEWGSDLQTEHERYLCEKVFQKPIFVINYPKGIKAFYMRLNDDQKTVAAMDLLIPQVGEIIGGAQREDRTNILLQRLKENNLAESDYSKYLDIRKFGSTPHSGFGLGFERFLMVLTGMQNIRDVIPFPRTPKNIV